VPALILAERRFSYCISEWSLACSAISNWIASPKKAAPLAQSSAPWRLLCRQRLRRRGPEGPFSVVAPSGRVPSQLITHWATRGAHRRLRTVRYSSHTLLAPAGEHRPSARLPLRNRNPRDGLLHMPEAQPNCVNARVRSRNHGPWVPSSCVATRGDPKPQMGLIVHVFTSVGRASHSARRLSRRQTPLTPTSHLPLLVQQCSAPARLWQTTIGESCGDRLPRNLQKVIDC
jgi:hypothetical protein